MNRNVRITFCAIQCVRFFITYKNDLGGCFRNDVNGLLNKGWFAPEKSIDKYKNEILMKLLLLWIGSQIAKMNSFLSNFTYSTCSFSFTIFMQSTNSMFKTSLIFLVASALTFWMFSLSTLSRTLFKHWICELYFLSWAATDSGLVAWATSWYDNFSSENTSGACTNHSIYYYKLVTWTFWFFCDFRFFHSPMHRKLPPK